MRPKALTQTQLQWLISLEKQNITNNCDYIVNKVDERNKQYEVYLGQKIINRHSHYQNIQAVWFKVGSYSSLRGGYVGYFRKVHPIYIIY